MDRCCKVGVVRNAAGLKGMDVRLTSSTYLPEVDSQFPPVHPVRDQLPAEVYVAQSVDHAVPSNGVGVLVIHDIFGTKIPNCKYIADHFASQGFTAIVPNFFKKVGAWPANESEVLKPLEGDEFGNWFGSITSEDFWMNDFGPEMWRAAGYLKDLGCTQLCVMGFCWGGKAAAVACRSGLFHAGVSSHGVAHGADDIIKSGCPWDGIGPKGGLLFQRPEVDGYFPDATATELRDAGAWVTTYEGVNHGFITRGDFNDAHVKKSADKAMAEAVALFIDTTGPTAPDSCSSEGHLGWVEAKPMGTAALDMSWGRALALEQQPFYPHWGSVHEQKASQPGYLHNMTPVPSAHSCWSDLGIPASAAGHKGPLVSHMSPQHSPTNAQKARGTFYVE